MGEVIAASDMLRARGLSERGFHALLAIAEKASAHNRQASVPLRHICAVLYGDVATKKRTAERAIQDLKACGVVRVVRRGFNNGHGHARAPIYEIQQLTETVTGDVSAPVENGSEAVTGGGNASTVPAKQGDRSRQNDDRSRHSSDGLNVVINGKSNGASARDCQMCDEGWILGPDGKLPLEPAAACSHRRCGDCGAPLVRDRSSPGRERCRECQVAGVAS